MNSFSNNIKEIALSSNKQWRLIENELCLVREFSPVPGHFVKNGVAIKPQKIDSKIPAAYASIQIECIKIPQNIKVTGFITHKEDFINLWAVFKDARLNIEKEEILAYWSMSRYTGFFASLFSAFMPKMIVMISPRGTFQSCSSGLKWPKNENPMVMVSGLGSRSWLIPQVFHKKGSRVENKRIK